MSVPTAPTVEQFIPMAKRVAHETAWLTADEDDIFQESLIALHLAFKKAQTINNVPSFAWVVLKRAAQAYYTPGERSRRPNLSLDNHPGWDFSTENSVEEFVLDNLEIQAYLCELESCCGKLHRWAVANLLDPEPEIKQLILASKRVDAVHHKYIREALHLSVPGWFKMLAQIREFTRTWLEQRGITPPETAAYAWVLGSKSS